MKGVNWAPAPVTFEGSTLLMDDTGRWISIDEDRMQNSVCLGGVHSSMVTVSCPGLPRYRRTTFGNSSKRQHVCHSVVDPSQVATYFRSGSESRSLVSPNLSHKEIHGNVVGKQSLVNPGVHVARLDGAVITYVRVQIMDGLGIFVQI